MKAPEREELLSYYKYIKEKSRKRPSIRNYLFYNYVSGQFRLCECIGNDRVVNEDDDIVSIDTSFPSKEAFEEYIPEIISEIEGYIAARNQ